MYDFVGTYSLFGASACASCSPGTFSTVTNATFCSTCPVGKYSDSGSSSCVDCLPGACLSCDAGMLLFVCIV